MAQQGIDSILNIQGIARNTAGSVSPDGELEEIIGLRYRDGSWKPCGDMEPITTRDNNLSGYDNIYIHTNVYHHVLGVKDGTLYWIGNISKNQFTKKDVEEKISEVKSNDLGIQQNGNLITIVDSGNSFTYSLFNEQKGQYITIRNDFNGEINDEYLIPEGVIDFKVDAIQKEDLTFYGKVEEKVDLAASLKEPDLDQICAASSLSLLKAKNAAKKNNWITQIHILCTAIELYDGNYILQSRPILLNSPVVSTDSLLKYNVEGNALYSNGTEVSSHVHKTYVLDEGWNSIPIEAQNNWDESKYNVRKNVKWRESENADNYDGKDFDNLIFANIETEKMFKQRAAGLNSGYLALIADKTKIVAKPIINQLKVLDGGIQKSSTYLTKNVIKYRVNQDIDLNYRDIIKGISIFITRGVDWYDETRKTDYRFVGDGNNFGTTLDGMLIYPMERGTYDVYIPERKTQNVIKEIESLSTFYKIASIPLGNIRKGDWMELPLIEGAMATLEQQERLNIENVARSSYAPKVSFSYNGRLHISNYTSRLFHGFPLPYFFTYQGLGQWQVPNGDVEFSKTNNVPCAWIEVELETKEGISRVVREYGQVVHSNIRHIYGLNPIISYPDVRARKMTIGVNYYISENAWGTYKKTFELKSHPYFNFSYYIDPDLKPIDIVVSKSTTSNQPVLPEGELNTIEQTSNTLKVSEVNNPIYFPLENTYQIGNGEVLGFATNTIALSVGQFGDAPLYVFTTDGIYGLFVDTSGAMVYPNSRPISRDICNNPRSITPIDGGVLFTTDRGLMLLQGAEVIDMSDIIEGVPFDINDVNVMPKILDHDRLVYLSNEVSKVNFLEYIKGALIGYNYYDKEIWITNPSYQYSYIYNMKVQGWSKRMEVAKELVPDYPKTYMLTSSGDMLDIAKENPTTVQTMILTRPIKFQTQEFKQNYRTIMRSLLKIGLRAEDVVTQQFVVDEGGQYDQLVNVRKGEFLHITITDYQVEEFGTIDRMIYYNGASYPRLYDLFKGISRNEYPDYTMRDKAGLYLFGSYDCKRWGLIGAKELSGEQRDIGLVADRIDCKYYRILFVGKLQDGSSIENYDMSVVAKLLAGKLR